MVGVATFGEASGKQSVAESFDDEFRGDLAVDTGAWMHGGVSANLVSELEAAPELEAVAARRMAQVQLDGTVLDVTGWSSTVSDVFALAVLSGSADDVGRTGLAVSEDQAIDHGWSVGDRLPVVFPTGESTTMTVAAVYAQWDGSARRSWTGRCSRLPCSTRSTSRFT